ncbi:hypothetical protein ONV78_22415 [Hahella sp. CR1]|uniref:hypothetical protein n=1 Tax=Hahella sp. CR1 TaxID=2992807 RepID=UPI002441750F|nr:hypothetical protein [Hahella sp. CR1]MDG9670510.1 hypothetical protein [Hahella sp. CR1]
MITHGLRKGAAATIILAATSVALLSPQASAQDDTASTTTQNCSAMYKSLGAYTLILEDLKKRYAGVSDGEITNIKATSTWSYVVSIAREERIEKITYKVNLNPDCTIQILERAETAVTPDLSH